MTTTASIAVALPGLRLRRQLPFVQLASNQRELLDAWSASFNQVSGRIRRRPITYPSAITRRSSV